MSNKIKHKTSKNNSSEDTSNKPLVSVVIPATILRSKSKGPDSLWVKIGGEGYETKIVKGVLWIRAESSMLGYLNAPNPFDAEGWFNT